MAVLSEIIENGKRVRHWSDEGFRLRQAETGILYDDAVDVVPCRYTYEETKEKVESAVAQPEERKDE